MGQRRSLISTASGDQTMEEKLSNSAKILERLEDQRVGKDVPKDAPKVSVIIPAYNISGIVAATLDSVFAQTFENFEVVIVNDGSKDTVELEAALESYFDRIVYGRQRNLGASEARNAAICLSRGELIAFLDGDDFWFPDCLENQVRYLLDNQLDMVYCDAELFGDNYLNGKTYMQTTPSNGEVNPISLIDGSCNVITSGTMLRREMLAEVDLFDTTAKRAQDFDLWFRLAKHGARIGYHRDILIKYRISTNSLSGSNVQRAERNISVLRTVREKYDFTEEEHEVWVKQIAFSEAEMELEKGKSDLIRGEYEMARRHIAKANEYYRKPKLLLLMTLLKISPRLTVKLFKRFRPGEFTFITGGER